MKVILIYVSNTWINTKWDEKQNCQNMSSINPMTPTKFIKIIMKCRQKYIPHLHILCVYCLKLTIYMVSKTAQRVNSTTMQTLWLSSIPKTHIKVRGQNWQQNCPVSFTGTPWHSYPPTYILCTVTNIIIMAIII